jgi:hypothetical protein
MTITSQFSAPDSALGYLYQVRVALLWSLRRLKSGSDFVVSLETLDDVTFETSVGTPVELLQTKYHRIREAAITDASPDLWKSLRIWFEGYAGKIIPPGTTLYLITTGKAPEGSIASYLRSTGRDVDSALKGLETVARTSKSNANVPAFAAFLNASPVDRRKLMEDIVIIDSAPSIKDLDGELKAEVFWATERQYHEAFLERIEGWWLRRSLKQLASSEDEDRIHAVEIDEQMSELRDQFKRDSLPIDKDLLTFDLDETTRIAHASSEFVLQLEVVEAGKRRIASAVRDYYRAFEQRSRWLRNELLLIGDIAQYDRRLIEEWELIFDAVNDELRENPTEEMKQKAGRKVLEWAEHTSLPIRPRVIEPFVSRGSLHMLSDDLRLGWHPEFRDKFSTFPESKESVA